MFAGTQTHAAFTVVDHFARFSFGFFYVDNASSFTWFRSFACHGVCAKLKRAVLVLFARDNLCELVGCGLVEWCGVFKWWSAPTGCGVFNMCGVFMNSI